MIEQVVMLTVGRGHKRVVCFAVLWYSIVVGEWGAVSASRQEGSAESIKLTELH